MPAKAIIITSELPRAGKTHLGAAIARWLVQEGYTAAPFVVAPRTSAGLSRAAAVLAEACGIAPAEEFEGNWGDIESLRQGFEFIIVEAPAGGEIPPGEAAIRVRELNGAVDLGDLGRLKHLPSMDLMPEDGPEVASLPRWTIATGPRTGVISHPLMTNFSEYKLVRAAEWLVAPAPGVFGVIFIPAASDENQAREWMAEQGLDAWLVTQRLMRCRILSSGWTVAGAEQIETGALLDHRVLSRILGCRVAPALPDEETLDLLAGWFAGGVNMEVFRRRYVDARE